MPILYDNGPRLSPDEFRQLRALINRRTGMQFDDASAFVFERRLRERLKVLGFDDFAKYYQHLSSRIGATAELDNAVEALVTNETYFFREEYQLRAFRSDLLPLIRAQALERGAKRVSIWSAGCSTGEEVYTIAILIARSGLFDDWEVRVVGSDISRRVLGVARRACYSQSSFRAMPDDYQEYFVREPEGSRVAPKIRAMCQFVHMNLLDRDRASLLGRVDTVFCRNVLIYLDAESRQKVIESFYERLHPGGHLLLGHSESLLSASTSFELAHLSSDMVYRKPLEARPATLVQERNLELASQATSRARVDDDSERASSDHLGASSDRLGASSDRLGASSDRLGVGPTDRRGSR